MRSLWVIALAWPMVANADPLESDRQSAEFSRPELRGLHAQQEMRHSERRDERQLQARERDAVPAVGRPAPALQYYRPLPLPGGPRHGVDPIPVQGLGG